MLKKAHVKLVQTNEEKTKPKYEKWVLMATQYLLVFDRCSCSGELIYLLIMQTTNKLLGVDT